MLDPIRRAALAAVDAVDDEVQELSRHIHDNPELAFEEVKASSALAEFLAAHGFDVELGVADLPTAFRATYRGGDGPTIALLAEYDALPEIGHGCGHNLIGTASCAAAVALKNAWPDLPGRIVVLGTPAEEGGGGKILMLERGAFDGVELSMMFHPSSDTTVNAPLLAAGALELRFSGKAAHASVSPWDGINAADAAMLFFAGINALRQHVRPDIRMHGYIAEAGVKANVTPAHSSVHFVVRAPRSEEMHRLMDRVIDVARGAALMTGASLDYDKDRPYLDLRHCASLGAAAARNLVEHLGIELTPTRSGTPAASSDEGNVSHQIPHLQIRVSISDRPIPGHSIEFRDAASSPSGAEALRTAAKTLALTAIDVLEDPALLARIKREHAAAVTPAGG